MPANKPKDTSKGKATATLAGQTPRARAALVELSQNVQPADTGTLVKPNQDTRSRPQRKSAKNARSLISDQYSLSVDPDSPREKRIRGRAARDVSPSIASDVDYLSHGSISEDFSEPEDEASLDQDELWSVDFNQENIHCIEDNDSEIDGDDAPDQPDTQYASDQDSADASDQDSADASDQDSGREWTGFKSKNKRAIPARKVAGSRRSKKIKVRPTLSAAKWLEQQNKKSEIGPDDPDAQRFRRNMERTMSAAEFRTELPTEPSTEAKYSDAVDAQDGVRRGPAWSVWPACAGYWESDRLIHLAFLDLSRARLRLKEGKGEREEKHGKRHFC